MTHLYNEQRELFVKSAAEKYIKCSVVAKWGTPCCCCQSLVPQWASKGHDAILRTNNTEEKHLEDFLLLSRVQIPARLVVRLQSHIQPTPRHSTQVIPDCQLGTPEAALPPARAERR